VVISRGVAIQYMIYPLMDSVENGVYPVSGYFLDSLQLFETPVELVLPGM